MEIIENKMLKNPIRENQESNSEEEINFKPPKFCFHKIPRAENLKKTETDKTNPFWFIGIIDCSGSMAPAWAFAAKNYNMLIDELPNSEIIEAEEIKEPENLDNGQNRDQGGDSGQKKLSFTSPGFWNKLVTKMYKQIKNSLGYRKTNPRIITYCFGSGLHEMKDTTLTWMPGGGTNLYLAFSKLDQILETIPVDDEVKVVFLSDGADSIHGDKLMEKLGTLKGAGERKKLTFMCIGVGKEFPTQVSLFLREKYHRGDGSIPSVFLVEYISDRAFFNKFQSIKKYCVTKQKIRLNPPQKLYPWDDKRQPETVEDSWLFSFDQDLILNDINKIEYQDQDFNLDAVAEIFRAWSQKLQIEFLAKKISFEVAKERAMVCFEMMNGILRDLKNHQKIDILGGKSEGKNNFLRKVLDIQLKRKSAIIKGYVAAVEEIMNGRDLSKLNEFEAAKVVGLGTIVGKAQQRVLAMKNMNADKLRSYIEDFCQKLEKISLKSQTDFEKTYKTKTSFYQLLQDSSLVSALKKFSSPLDFLTTLPLYGLGLVVKRGEGSIDDPWKVIVKGYELRGPGGELGLDSKDPSTYKKGATHLFLDTSSFEPFNYRFELKTDHYANCVCPLIPKTDGYLGELYTTDLMRYAMSYNTTLENDYVNEESWMVLLSDLFAMSLKNNDQVLKDLILSTLDAIEKTSRVVKNLIELACQKNWTDFFSKSNKRSFCYLILFYIGIRSQKSKNPEETRLTEDNLVAKEACQMMILHFFSERLKENKISEIVKTESSNNLEIILFEKYTPKRLLKEFYTANDLTRYFQKGVFKEMDQIETELSSNNLILCKEKSSLTSSGENALGYNEVNKLHRILTTEDISEDLAFRSIHQALTHSEDPYKGEMSVSVTKAKQLIFKKVKDNKLTKKFRRTLSLKLINKLKPLYYTEFQRAHWGTLPQSWSQIVATCKAKGIDYHKLDYDAERGFVKNACMSPNCPHQYIVKRPRRRGRLRIRSHMGGWRSFCPNAFHSYVREHRAKPHEEILEGFLVHSGIKDLAVYGVRKDQVLAYIERIVQGYNNMS